MRIKCFEDIIAWQKSQDIAVEIYSNFKEIKDYGFRDQILRASVSISNNIAEGFERNSDKEFIRFLNIACGSCSELKSMLYLAMRLDYLTKEKGLDLLSKAAETLRIINGLIKSLKISLSPGTID